MVLCPDHRHLSLLDNRHVNHGRDVEEAAPTAIMIYSGTSPAPQIRWGSPPSVDDLRERTPPSVDDHGSSWH